MLLPRPGIRTSRYKCALKCSFEPCPPKQDFLFRTLKRARNKHFLVSNPFELENFRSLFLLYSKAQKLQKPVGKLSFVVRIGRCRRQPNTAWTGQNTGSSRALGLGPARGTPAAAKPDSTTKPQGRKKQWRLPHTWTRCQWEVQQLHLQILPCPALSGSHCPGFLSQPSPTITDTLLLHKH